MSPEAMADVLIYTLPVMTAGLTVAVAVGTDFIRRKIRNRMVGQAMNLLDQTVMDVVGELNRTVVADLKRAKADGKLTPDEQAQIKHKAVNLVLGRLGRSFVFLLQYSFGSVIGLIGSKIEAAVHDQKKIVYTALPAKNTARLAKAG